MVDDNGEQPKWLSRDEQQTWRAYIDGSQRLLGMLNRDLTDDAKLSLGDFRILVLLSESPTGAVRMSELADGIVASRSKLTHQVRRMEEQNLVKRESCADDGRGVFAHITDQGRAALRDAASHHVSSVREYFIDLLDPADLKALRKIFEKVDAHLIDQQRR
ncbi:winged helix-turn-helix transcriptional regulator [Hoyosella rhizosphaerae]|uniref:Transcriptional regulator n=1 Tax=Hoyosella rhizosphaerae TaxID=1755582 RepID=A0A916UJY9_9ACTN|nr:MarR family winged helix-turn-helix transcriptional regulator [Hoyosella rhizosphaerae]MBN4925447.1 winged helix-turn-helix transcriptional regulator [Hoyosella rhizosphaerae]GGC75113.1 transcriptional regulator [Hoyosella rhizosphaerae]